ncbi:MAG: 30S ribosomal protein S15 [Elusimicrobia bacterium CG1_02_63_36]|nr:MAG: 30S ribosomal protein S15 [Elusimicrobia bacterium CG1_02_63_36]PIP83475.1 MAG: 30S ribosomal protein S15 [Elusimicrobia bacterium CG22_combo_CG10-13_8_21_14_all_63_91]PJA12321.1 MAG: 30S ribosomal protein S15 [Elusimicrobia bacterium CG_4_10_14_0_2_um_filter_63_34]PJB24727.1 MAG: 30S ribosomal protein S15 [Elusimicrobia bacterium CG_4_9_14_3_um_filter_62_55]
MITKEKKTDIIKKFQASAKDVGSSPIQVAMLTQRIREISDHMKTHKKDYASQVGLLKLVSQRRSLLAYIKKHDLDGYGKLIKELDLRK